jgi:nucleotide-binding universal stress UspA family protein
MWEDSGMETVFQRIVVPFDGSPPSERALDLARRLAASTAGSLLVMTVFERDKLAAECATSGMGLELTSILDSARKASDDVVARGAARCGTLSVRTRVVEGPIVDGILAAALEWNGDLIVMGSHGRSGIARLVLGSVTEGVLRRASVPVLAVRCPASA